MTYVPSEIWHSTCFGGDGGGEGLGTGKILGGGGEGLSTGKTLGGGGGELGTTGPTLPLTDPDVAPVNRELCTGVAPASTSWQLAPWGLYSFPLPMVPIYVKYLHPDVETHACAHPPGETAPVCIESVAPWYS